MENAKKSICKYISEDKELNAFFKKLTIYYKGLETEKLKEFNEVDLEEDAFKIISEILEAIENSGIKITGKENLLKKNYYKDSGVLIEHLFPLLKLNGYGITSYDINALNFRITFGGGCSFKELTQKEYEYKNCIDNIDYNLLKQEYEKLYEKYQKKSEKSKKGVKKSKTLEELEEKLDYIEKLEKEANFFKNLTREQMYNIVNLYLQMKEIKSLYKNDYFHRQKENYVEENKFNLCQIGLDKLLEKSLVEIDINNIIKKILIINMVVQNNPVKEELMEKEYDFDIDVVFSFIKLKEKELHELQQKVFNINNFSLAVDVVCDKTLKK